MEARLQPIKLCPPPPPMIVFSNTPAKTLLTALALARFCYVPPAYALPLVPVTSSTLFVSLDAFL